MPNTTNEEGAVRDRDQILNSLERLYREAFAAAEARQDTAAMEALDFQFRRDQVGLEVLLDIRGLLLPQAPASSPEETVTGLLDTAQKIRKLTKLR